MSRVFLIASYPKSGNTWVRIFLLNYWNNERSPIDINDVRNIPIASSRSLMDQALGFSSSNLTHVEAAAYYSRVLRFYAEHSTDKFMYFKAHDAYTVSNNGEPLFPADSTSGAIYVIRNPLDVVLSSAHYFDITIDEAIERMANEHFCLGYETDRSNNQLRQRLLTWSNHVLSWVDRTEFPVIIVRYEDLLTQSLAEFARIVRFVEGKVHFARLKSAIAFSSFENLQRQEQQKSFHEKINPNSLFFREGKSGVWQQILTRRQIQQIIDAHSHVMSRFGYISGVE
jgi:hypothetical protein